MEVNCVSINTEDMNESLVELINYPGVKVGFDTLRINTSDCKDAIK
ncbi:MAG: hypothetical protein KBT35_04805 [Firmicutes bacterium]|nr:hypothetical protein [Candidatus Colivicinus equi]